MFSITIKGNTPDELRANVALYLAANNPPTASVTATATIPPMQVPPAMAAPNPAPAVTAAMPPTAAPAVPAVANVPMPPAQTAIPTIPAPTAISPMPPTAPAPAYSFEDLANAGARLAQSGKMAECAALLAKYNIQSIEHLPPEQYGAFATELRALGAPI